MQETGQQIRANVHTCADRGTLYTIWHMYWWRLLLELRLLLLSYGVLGVGTFRISPRSCRAPRAFVQDPRARIYLPGIQAEYPWDWHTLDSRVGFCPQQIILVAGRLAPGPH